MRIVRTTIRLAALFAVLLFGAAFVSPALAGEGKSYSESDHHKDHDWHGHKPSATDETSDDEESGGGTISEDNFPDVCNDQLGYWTEIPMPGDQSFCVFHFTEFFKGNSGSSDNDTLGVSDHDHRGHHGDRDHKRHKHDHHKSHKHHKHEHKYEKHHKHHDRHHKHGHHKKHYYGPVTL